MERKPLYTKQQLKTADMYEALVDAGFTVSYTTVRNFVNKEAKKIKDVFYPLTL